MHRSQKFATHPIATKKKYRTPINCFILFVLRIPISCTQNSPTLNFYPPTTSFAVYTISLWDVNVIYNRTLFHTRKFLASLDGIFCVVADDVGGNAL